jgi:hypothetical protein
VLDKVPLFHDNRYLRGLEIIQMRRGRQARNLVSAAEWHLDERPHRAPRRRAAAAQYRRRVGQRMVR